jgi:hypothetical protein
MIFDKPAECMTEGFLWELQSEIMHDLPATGSPSGFWRGTMKGGTRRPLLYEICAGRGADRSDAERR